jgi:hypothetical protein
MSSGQRELGGTAEDPARKGPPRAAKADPCPSAGNGSWRGGIRWILWSAAAGLTLCGVWVLLSAGEADSAPGRGLTRTTGICMALLGVSLSAWARRGWEAPSLRVLLRLPQAYRTAISVGTALFLAALATYPFYLDWPGPLMRRIALGCFHLCAYGVSGLCILGWFCSPNRRGLSGRAAGIVDWTLFNLSLTLILLEVALRGMGLFSDSPLYSSALKMRAGDRRQIEIWRHEPGTFLRGFPVNSAGYYDTEFATPKPEGVFRIVALADSFGPGVVPYQFNFLTLLERQLEGFAGSRAVEVCNMGIPCIGPPQYRIVLQEEGLALEPDLIIVCFFVGNDFPYAAWRTADAKYENRWDRLMLFRVAGRIWRHLESGALRAPPARSQEDSSTMPAHVKDWRLERPTMLREQFLEVQSDRAIVFDRDEDDSGFQRAAEILADIHRIALRATGKPLVVVLIPDQMEVDAELREIVSQRREISWDLEKPLRFMREQLPPHGIVLIDLQQAIQAAHDELGRVYHLQDTHWNANGNRAAAAEIARQLRLHPELAR